MADFKVGDIVSIDRSFLGEPAGVLAYVYEKYNIGHNGVSVITENGVDLGGFGEDEYHYLDIIAYTDLIYEFKNVMQLDNDFETIIKPVFKKIKK